MPQGKIIKNKVDQLMFCQYPDPSSQVFFPAMPFTGEIPGKLHVGKTIQIQGLVSRSPDIFQINLRCGASKDPIALHLSVRFKNQVVVRNTFQNGNWETEETDGPFPFSLDEEFMMLIQVQSGGYLIAVNGQHCWIFAHRLPFTDVRTLNIEGPVKIWKVEYINHEKKGQHGYSPQSPVISRFEPVYNPPVPFSYPFNGGIESGMMIYISGRPSNIFKRFSINLQCGCAQQRPPDIAFHFDVRAFSKMVVRNTRRNGVWGDEEVAAPYFPFQRAVFFDMIIYIHSNKFLVAVNGQHFVEYSHRMTQFSEINTLKIENDVILASVRCS